MHLRSARNPPLDLKLAAQDPNTSVLELKRVVAEREKLAWESVRILWKKRPVGDAKVLRDLVEEGKEGELELGVMVMGGGAAVGTAGTGGEGKDKEGVAREKATAVLGEDVFWTDLKGFMRQRVGHDEVAREACEAFRKHWETR